MSDYEDYLDAIIDNRNNNRLCEVCDKYVKVNECQSCDHAKNGYCVLFRVQAEKDALEFNMRK
jgi:recombinational DNA repair protein RecR